MTCPYCHSKIDDKNKYCNYCGNKINTTNEHENQYDYSNRYSNVEKKEMENHDNQFSYSMLYSNMFNKTASSDEDYLKAYIGPNYETIKNEKISIPAFLFGTFYLFYRKLWSLSLILLIIDLALTAYQDSKLTLLVKLIITIFLGLKFNKIYLQHANKKVDEIKISNPDKTSTELLDICKKKGGTTNIAIIIVAFLEIIFLISIITIPAMSFYLYSNNQQQTTTVEKEEAEINQYKTIENMTYKVPKKTKLSKYSSDNYHYYTTLSSSPIDCSFNISINKYTNLYKTPDEYIQKNVFKNYESEELINTTTTINNITWRYLSIGSDSRTENYYVTSYHNVLYIIEVTGYGESKTSTCKNAENNLINSITFKSPIPTN